MPSDVSRITTRSCARPGDPYLCTSVNTLCQGHDTACLTDQRNLLCNLALEATGVSSQFADISGNPVYAAT